MIDLGRYVGLPFGHGPGEVTCWSLIRRVYAETLGIDLPEHGDISANDLRRVARGMRDEEARSCWVATDEPECYDIALMRSAQGGAAVCHVGLMLDPVRVLHAEQVAGSVVVSVDHFTVKHRIAGYRRYRV